MQLATQEALCTASIRSRERLGGLLKYYTREAAPVFEHTRLKARWFLHYL